MTAPFHTSFSATNATLLPDYRGQHAKLEIAIFTKAKFLTLRAALDLVDVIIDIIYTLVLVLFRHAL